MSPAPLLPGGGPSEVPLLLDPEEDEELLLLLLLPELDATVKSSVVTAPAEVILRIAALPVSAT